MNPGFVEQRIATRLDTDHIDSIVFYNEKLNKGKGKSSRDQKNRVKSHFLTKTFQQSRKKNISDKGKTKRFYQLNNPEYWENTPWLKTDEVIDSNSPIKRIEHVKVQVQTDCDEKR